MSIDYIGKYAGASGGLITVSSQISNLSVSFYAFVTSFNDSMTSNWNEEQVYGRPDPTGTFQNTSRKISLAFDIPSKDRADAQKKLEEINKLKQMMYPAYSSTGRPAAVSSEFRTVEEAPEVTTNALSLAKSPLVRLKFANLIQNQDGDGLLGWINSQT